MVYELIFILVRRVLITLELVHAALLRTRTVRDLHACACVSVRVRKVPAPLPAAPRCLWARCAPVQHLCCLRLSTVAYLKSSSSSSSHAGGGRRLADVFIPPFSSGETERGADPGTCTCWDGGGVAARGGGGMPTPPPPTAYDASSLASAAGAAGWSNAKKCRGFLR